MIPIGPDPSATAERAVHGACDANRETPDAAAERAPVVGFDDQVQVIVLNGELNDPEVAVGGDGEGAADGAGMAWS